MEKKHFDSALKSSRQSFFCFLAHPVCLLGRVHLDIFTEKVLIQF